MKRVEQELKPCPFCGCLAWLHTHPRIFRVGTEKKATLVGHRIECEGACHAMTCYWHEKWEAVANWNRRAIQ